MNDKQAAKNTFRKVMVFLAVLLLLNTAQSRHHDTQLRATSVLSAAPERLPQGIHTEQAEVAGRSQVLRGLRQIKTGNVTVVNTPTELTAAVQRGDAHIELRSHIDLSSTPPLKPASGGDSTAVLLGQLPGSIQSIRGNCVEAPPQEVTRKLSGVAALPLQPRQCLVVADLPLLWTLSNPGHSGQAQAGNLWLDGLYLRYHRTPRSPAQYDNGLVNVSSGRGKLWMTYVVMQGDGDGVPECTGCGVSIEGGLYAEGCTFAHFDGASVVSAAASSSATLTDCRFEHNTLSEAIIQAHGNGALVRAQGPRGLRNNAFGTSAAAFRTIFWTHTSKPVFYSDAATPVLNYRGSGGGRRMAGTTRPLPLQEWPLRAGLTADDAFLTHLRQVLTPISRDTPGVPLATGNASRHAGEATPPGSTMHGNESLNVGVMVGGAVAVTVILGTTLLLRRRHLKRTGAASAATNGSRNPGAQEKATELACKQHHVWCNPEQTGLPAGGQVPAWAPTQLAPILPPAGPYAAGAYAYAEPPPPPGTPPDLQLPPCVRSSREYVTSPLFHNPAAGGAPHPQYAAPYHVLAAAHQLPANHLDPVMFCSTMPPAVSPHARLSWDSHSPAARSSFGGGPGLRWSRDGVDEMARLGWRRCLRPPGPGARTAERLEFVAAQLESLRGRPVCDGLVLDHGADSRRHGGQAVVQFASDPGSHQAYAIKAYVSRTAFHREREQYADPDNPLKRFMPRLRAILGNEEGDFVDASGNPMPPCIIMEKGESLDLWMQHNEAKMDARTCMRIIDHVCQCLRDLHAAGYAHRDLKPGNIMWLPSTQRWTLIDFGCAARIGEEAPLGFSLKYAAPEVLRACYRRGKSRMRVTAAEDMWSLGVVAVELLSGRPAFEPHLSREQVIARTVGEEQLPWEDPLRARELLGKAGDYREPLLVLLMRQPGERPSVREFLHLCSRVQRLQ